DAHYIPCALADSSRTIGIAALFWRAETRPAILPDELDKKIPAVQERIGMGSVGRSVHGSLYGVDRWKRAGFVNIVAQIAVFFSRLRVPRVEVRIGYRLGKLVHDIVRHGVGAHVKVGSHDISVNGYSSVAARAPLRRIGDQGEADMQAV